jgi:hypothetical protein
VIEFPNGAHVRHKKDGYHGWIDDKTRLAQLFTGGVNCLWQYRIRIINEDKRRIAPPDDLEIFSETPKTLSSDRIIYHFTDIRNVESIKKRGLLSWQRLLQWKVDHVPSSNDFSRELDVKKNLQNYVRLCLTKDHPMAYTVVKEKRVQKLVWLKIKGDVVNWRTTLFSDTNSVKNGAVIDGNRDTAFKSGDSQAEILIENALASKWIEW